MLEEVELGRNWEESSPATWPEVGSAGSLGEEEEKERNEKRRKMKKEMKCKGMIFIWFGFYEGDAIK